jgi:uncharacterized protein (DUF2141 family)
MTPAVVLLAIQLLTGPLGLAPCTVRLRVRVEPMKANRSVEVTLTSDDFSSASRQELHGDQAAKTQREQTYADLPPGSYDIRAVVQRAGLRAVNTRVAFECLGDPR